MTMESAREARGGGYAGGPTGFRRLTPSLLRADRTAEGFDGLPEGVTVPGQLLAAFKTAAPRLGLSPRLVHAVDWLFRFTQPQDWGRGGRPIVWPSASMQQESLGLSPTQAKAINRALIDAGVVTMKDSPNGKRYGVRDRAGRITEAYGFDLSPIAARHAEFVDLAEEARAERAEMGRLMAAPGLPCGLCRGEGAPGGAAGVSDGAGGDQLPQQAEGRLRRDREIVRQATRGDDRRAKHVIERQRQVRARGAGQDGSGRLGSLQTGQFLADGAGCSRDTGEKAGQPFGANPQGEAVMKLDRGRPERQGNVAAEAVLPPETGGEEQSVHGERIGVALPVDPVPGTAPGPDQRRILIAPVCRCQPVIDCGIAGGCGPAQGLQGTPHGRDISNGAPGAMLGKPPPEPGQPESGTDLVRWHHIGRAAGGGHGRQLGIQAAGMSCDNVGAGQARVAQGEIARVYPGVGVCQPPSRLPISDAGAQALDNRRGRSRRGCFQPGYGVLGVGEWHQEGMHIGVASGRLARGGGREAV
jgi:hypothetical protein